MSSFRDVVARMAVDPEFARYARANPDAVVAQYGLATEEADRLRGLADAQVGDGPRALGVRLSKSSIGTGALGSVLSASDDTTAAFDTAVNVDGPIEVPSHAADT